MLLSAFELNRVLSNCILQQELTAGWGSKPLDEAGDIGQFTERDFCQTEAASDVISGKGEKGD